MLLQILHKGTTVTMLCFVVSSMLVTGASLTLAQIVHPLRNVRLVAVTLLANFILMPLAALILAKALWLDDAFGVGLLLLGCAAGAPFLPKLAQLAKGDLAFAVGAMVLLTVLSIGYLPLVLPLLLPGASVDPSRIALSLVVLMLVPLGAGLVGRARYPGLATRASPALAMISNVSLVALLALISVVNFDNVLQLFGTRGIFAGLLFIVVGFAVGWLLGGPKDATRRVLALGTSSRNFAAALIVANQSFSDPKASVMIIVVAIAGFAILLPLSRKFSHREVARSDRTAA
jgi:BASS family bile acid:Na+ symporter